MIVLITSVGKKVSLVQAFQNAGAYVIAIDIDRLSVALEWANERYICPARGEDLIEFIKNIEHDIIVPSSDNDVVFFAEHQDKFDSLVVVPSYDTAVTCRDKLLFTHKLAAHKFNFPSLVNPGFLGEYPMIARPRFGSGSNGIIIIDPLQSQKEVKDSLKKQWDDYIVQEYLYNAQEYTIDLFATKEKVISVIPRKRLSVINGESWIGETDYNLLIINECVRLAKYFNLRYHNTIQGFLMGDSFLFTEVNPRFGGGFTLGIAAGANTPKFLIDLANGYEPVYDGTANHKTMLRFTQDIFI